LAPTAEDISARGGRTIKRLQAAALAAFLAARMAGGAAAETPAWTLENPTDANYVDEPVRLGLALPQWAKDGNCVVLADGKPVGWPCTWWSAGPTRSPRRSFGALSG